MTFGERIVYFREKKGLSQKGLADLIGITANRLYYYEKDKRQPDVALIKAIAKALAISGDDLLGTEWATEKSPALENAEDKVTKEEMETLLRALGFISDTRELSEKDVKFVAGVFDLLDAWFKR